MYYVYILQSLKDHRYYIGCTQDIDERLKRHNSGQVKATKHRMPLNLVYSELATSNLTARRREKQIKSYKGGNAFKKLITGSSSDG